MKDDLERDELLVFASELGWMSLRMRGEAVRAVVVRPPFGRGRTSGDCAGPGCQAETEPVGSGKSSQRLLRYAEGVPVDFCDLPVDSGHVTEFQARVLKACREIPYGKTITYGELAATAGRPGAARAVGNCMAGNRVPLIVPCHRVVRAGGHIGPYSAAGGSATKRRLLEMEAVAASGTEPGCNRGGPTASSPTRKTVRRWARQTRVIWARLLEGDQYTVWTPGSAALAARTECRERQVQNGLACILPI